MHTIAYLGPAGTFSEEAAIRYAADRGDAAYLPLASIPAVVTAIETDAATVGLLPIENLLEGSVSFTLDLLIHETALQIAGETVIPIRQYLVTRPGRGDVRGEGAVRPPAVARTMPEIRRALPAGGGHRRLVE
jgi:prephenate dehydratase